MTVKSAWVLNASTATPAQSRQDTRLAPIGTVTPGTTDSLISRGGLIPGPGTGPCNLSMSGMTATISLGRGVVQGTSAQGAYPLVVTAADATVIANGHASLPRIDTLWLIALDNLIDASGSTIARIEYTQGTPNASPVAPTAPAAGTAYLRLWDIRVPAGASAGAPPDWVGGGLLTDRRTYTAAVGGITPDPNTPGSYAGQWRDAGGQFGVLERYTGSFWEAVMRLGASGKFELSDVSLTRPSTGTMQVNGHLAVTGIGRKTWAAKSADESVTSSTTLQNDDHLSASIPAAGSYAFELFLLVGTGDSAADLKVAFTGPSGTWHFGGTGGHTGAYTTGTSGVGEYFAVQGATGPSSFLVYGISSGATTWVRLSGVLIASASGTFQFQWAQVASSGTATRLLAGSWMRTERVA